MVYHYLKSGINIEDDVFDEIYPAHIRNLSRKNWTPIDVAIKTANFLVKSKDTKVLDIGSGVGKFCFVGSAVSEGQFIGIEQKHDYINIAKGSLALYDVKNVFFIHSSIESINFSNYDSFYFFNSFPEPLNTSQAIKLTSSNHREYSSYVKTQFEQLPVGTRIVTYYDSNKDIPLTYDLLASDFGGYLKFWIKNHKYEDLRLLEEQLIKNGITRLKNIGLSNVNKQNILKDEVYKSLFENILRSQLGRGIEADEIILNLLSLINKL